MKRLLTLLISVLIILSFVLAAEFTPQGNINLRNLFNITNAPSYNGTEINISGNATAGFFVGDGSFLTSISVSTPNIFDQVLNTTSNVTHFNVTVQNINGGSIFATFYNWIIGLAPSSNYLDFNGTHLEFNETRLNDTIALEGVSLGFNSTTNSSYLLNTGDTATGDYTFDTDTFFIDSGNNRIGVGTVSPAAPFEIQSLLPSMRQTRYATVASQSAGITVQRSGGTTVGTDVIVENGWRIANFNLRGFDGIVYRTAATIEAWIDGTPGSGDMPGRLVFSTTADAASSATERLRIDSNGSVGINTTTPQNLLNVLGDANITGFIFGNGSQLVSLTESQIIDLIHSDATWITNWTNYNSSWSSITNTSYLTEETNWNSNSSAYNASWSSITNTSYLTSFTEADPFWSSNSSAYNTTWSSGEANETARFDFLVQNDCSAGQVVIGVQPNGTVLCTDDADSGGAGGNIFDQVLNTTSNVTFNQLNLSNFGNDLIPFADSRFNFGSTALRWLVGFLDELVITNFLNVSEINTGGINATDWANVTIDEGQITDLFHNGTTNTNADTICSGTTTYLDGEGNCDELNAVYEVQLVNEAGLYAVLSDVSNFLQNLVEDTTPQLGGYLDTNTNDIGSTSDEIENIYVATNSKIFFGDGQEAFIVYNGTALIISG